MAVREIAFCIALACVLLPGFGKAQDVTLVSPDGGVEISGDLLGFDGEFYRIDTQFGELTVDASGVTCDGPGCPSLSEFVAELRFSGAAAMADTMFPALLTAFAERNGYTAKRTRQGEYNSAIDLMTAGGDQRVGIFEFTATSTEAGFADLFSHEADFVLSMREIRPEERQTALYAGMGDLTDSKRSRVLALDAVVPIVSPENPLRRIEPLDLARLFAGELSNWSDLGGPDAPIALHLPSANTGLGQAIEDRLLKPVQMEVALGAIRHEPTLDIAKAVASDPFAIGIASFAETQNAQVVTLSGACGFTLQATRRTIKTEDYPLTSPMFLYMPARRLPKIGRDFVAFLRTSDAQNVIREAGFVDQIPELISMDEQGLRLSNAIASAGEEVPLSELQRLVAALAPFDRLTTSFRFETGSARLDAQSRENVEQLAQAIEQGTYDNKTILFVGFSDGEGAAEPNRKISVRRAEAVRGAITESADLADFSRVELRVEAFGEALPMACDDSAWGRKANRRVEVWVR